MSGGVTVKPRPTKARALELRGEGRTNAEIAEALGCSAATVGSLLRGLGPITAVPRPAQRPERLPGETGPAAALALLSKGLSVHQAARETGLSDSAAWRLLDEARASGWLKGPPPPWEFVLRFPAGPLTPGSRCRCDVDPIPVGSRFVCAVCSRTGWDWHSHFRNVRPPLEVKPKVPRGQLVGVAAEGRRGYEQPTAEREAVASAVARMTRKERRRLEFAAREAARATAVLAKAG